MADINSYWINKEHMIQVRTDLHRRRHEIIVDEGKPDSFVYRVSLVQGKGVIDFLERINGLKS